MGCYIAPDDASTIESFFTAISQRPWVVAPLVTGNFNMDLTMMEGNVMENLIMEAFP